MSDIKEIINQGLKYYNDFEQARKQMTVCGMEYPQMKIIDSCFWQVDFDFDENKEL